MLYLVGSRFYGLHRNDSDWDFLGANDEETHRYCVQLGLKRIESRHVRYVGHDMDVCLVNNLDKRLYARDQLLTLDYASMTKSERALKIKEFINGL